MLAKELTYLCQDLEIVCLFYVACHADSWRLEWFPSNRLKGLVPIVAKWFCAMFVIVKPWCSCTDMKAPSWLTRSTFDTKRVLTITYMSSNYFLLLLDETSSFTKELFPLLHWWQDKPLPGPSLNDVTRQNGLKVFFVVAEASCYFCFHVILNPSAQ